MGCLNSAMRAFQDEKELLRDEEKAEQLVDIVNAFTVKLAAIQEELEKKAEKLEQDASNHLQKAIQFRRENKKDKALHNMQLYKITNHHKSRLNANLITIYSTRLGTESNSNNLHLIKYITGVTTMINNKGATPEEMDKLMGNMDEQAEEINKMSIWQNQLLASLKNFSHDELSLDEYNESDEKLMEQLDKMMAGDGQVEPTVLSVRVDPNKTSNTYEQTTQVRPKKNRKTESAMTA
jgi:hypothetical protein